MAALVSDSKDLECLSSRDRHTVLALLTAKQQFEFVLVHKYRNPDTRIGKKRLDIQLLKTILRVFINSKKRFAFFGLPGFSQHLNDF